MIYRRDIRIEFNHCDPAGIVFYPRYFEMTNSMAENFFRDVAGHPYDAMMEARQGAPTATLTATYHLPSRLGEVLDWRLTVPRIGRSSIALHLEAWCGESHRVTADLTLVFVTFPGRPEAWPQDVRDRITAFMEAA